jgi:hypothetical protein
MASLRLNPGSVGWIQKRALGRAGVRDVHRYGAHSRGAGFATTAFDKGVPEFKIRQQTGHRTSRMLEKYIRSGTEGAPRSRFEPGALGDVHVRVQECSPQ